MDASPASLSAKATGKAGTATSAIRLAADGRSMAAAAAVGLLPTAAAPARESSGGEYAPDSRALLARVNRWWKAFDEGYMQPHFGGPNSGSSRNGSMANLVEAAVGSNVMSGQSGQSFTVPATIGNQNGQR